ncbi:hypothetical protein BIV23_06485 [Streptomyces monashensis]|uniref:Uncharacterized protein n=2 Tax=Streptomyces monashensis TaxID=1678012 RepID=A0A1S2QLZ3_9ACTN|nr:hypothetical protein BIV23_06485 [Streptomyces monashensis]
MPHRLRIFLPDRVVGRYYGDGQTLRNGDFGTGTVICSQAISIASSGGGHNSVMATTAPAESPARRRTQLLVPVLTAVSAGLLVAHLAFSSDTFQHCRYLGPSTRMYVTSWAGLVCALGALLAFGTLPRTERRGLALVSAVLGLLLTLGLLATVYGLYAPDPAGGDDCSGLHLLVP